jgi:hypothetical protein
LNGGGQVGFESRMDADKQVALDIDATLLDQPRSHAPSTRCHIANQCIIKL